MADLYRVKSQFFTARGVADELDKGTRAKLTKFGAYVRRRAKSSLKYAEGPSQPGKPPHVHRSARFTRRKGNKGQRQPVSPLRELIFYSYDRERKSVIIGPAIGGSRTGAPRTLEESGQAKVDGKTVFVRARPTMRPAFEIELVKVGGDFRNIVTQK